MAKNKFRLVYTLEAQITESEAGAFEVGEQRERNHRYFTGQPLGNEQKGRSQYISPDVMDVVQSKKALFHETFLSNRQTVAFKSGGGQNPAEADAKTAYTMSTLRRNKHEELFRDGWHDAFVAKKMTVLCEWSDDTNTVTLDVTGAQRPQIQQLIAQQGNVVGVDEANLQVQMMPGVQGQTEVFMGSIDVEVADGFSEITLLEPERYYRDPLASYVSDSQWASYEDEVTRGELINQGYNEEQVMELPTDYRFRSAEEDTSRKAHDMSWTRRKQYDRIETQGTVTMYKTWTWINLMSDEFSELMEEQLSFQPEDAVKLYKICWAHGEVLQYADGTLAVEEADEMPFVEWAEIKISHAEHGMCSADIEAHAQKTNSTLKRLIIDNQQMRNNTRYEAVMGALKNPRDLMDNRIGGVAWVRQIGSIAPLASPELSPLTFNVLQMMQADSERRDGYSGLGKGMNNDAVRYQNADSMIERLTTAGTRRPMAAARDWAMTFLIPLCQMIVRQAIKNDQSQSQLEVKGRMIPVVPAQWTDNTHDMEVAVALTPEEGKQHAQNMLMMHQVMSQDPQMAMVYGIPQKHALFDQIFDAMGVSDTTPYMERPDSPEFQQKMQQNQQEMEAEKQKQDAIAQLAVKMEQSKDRREWERLRWDQTNDMQDNNLNEQKQGWQEKTDVANFMLDQDKFNWDRFRDSKELKIEEQQQRAAKIGDK